MTDSSPETFHCPHCGTETPVSDPDSPTLCPQCNREFVAARLETIPGPQPPGESRDREMPELAPGVELGGYRLEKEIGRGGMGIVFEAVQKSLGRKVAVKVLPRKLVGDPEFVARFEREGLALAQLNHPNIVQIIDKGISGEVCFLVMEFVEGVSLRRVMESGELAAEQALAIVPQICAALEYAHGRGVVHRDIKPENIMMDTDGSVKITDFGLARLVHGESPAALERLTRTNVMMGTPDYMAPEQREKAKEVDHRADIYSLGVIFYEMLTGELPLGRFPPPSRKVRVDVRLDEVVFKALEKEPELRYQRASQMHRDVTEVREGATPVAIVASAPGPEADAARPGRPDRPPAAVICGHATASMILGIMALLGFSCAMLSPLLAIILGVVARNKIKEAKGRLSGDGMALFGLTAGIGMLILDALGVVTGGVSALGMFTLLDNGGLNADPGQFSTVLDGIIGGSMLLNGIHLFGRIVVLFAAIYVSAAYAKNPGQLAPGDRGRISGLALAAFALAILPLVAVFFLILGLATTAMFRSSASRGGAGGRGGDGVKVEYGPGGVNVTRTFRLHGAEGVVRPEIRALIEGTGEVLGDSGAVAAMRPIAKRTDLSPAEQILLAEEAFDEIISDSSTVEILEVLIANPAFSKAASKYIAENTDELLASTSKRKILALLAAKRFPVEAGSSTEAPDPGGVAVAA